MTTEHPNRHVAGYLRQLETAAAGLAPQRRTELVEEIREHIDQALREVATDDEVSVRNVLERLGSPEEIAAAAGAGPVTPEPAHERKGAGLLEIATLAVFALGGLLPVIGWLIGVAFVSASEAWSTRDKAVGLLLSLVPVLMMSMTVILGLTIWSLGALEVAVLLALFTGPISALYLAARLRQTPRLAH